MHKTYICGVKYSIALTAALRVPLQWFFAGRGKVKVPIIDVEVCF